jgi:uncharacterized FlaG/YvyC family protein
MPILINTSQQTGAFEPASPNPAMPSVTTDTTPQDTGTVQSPSQPAVPTEQLKDHLADALKKTGIKAEIDLGSTGYMVVKYIDPDNQKVQFQLPNQTVLDLVAALNQSQTAEASAAGNLIDHFA